MKIKTEDKIVQDVLMKMDQRSLIGQKKCQAEYANTLSKSSLCISAGLINDVSVDNIVIALEDTIKNANLLSKNAQKKVDGKGLQRIADIVYRYIS